MSKKPIFIAEIKTVSPYGYKSPYSFHKLMETAIQYGDWISVHDNALWGGDYETISFVRRNTNKPILAKGLHRTNDCISRALSAGADYVLVVDRIPNTTLGQRAGKDLFAPVKEKCLCELSYSRLREIVGYNSNWKNNKFVCNSRDLSTGKPKNHSELQDFLNFGVWTCQASGIVSKRDVNPNVDAFIVGEHLMEFVKEI